MGAEAEKYLKDHLIPQLFEGLMTGLIYNKPERPVDFLENALAKIKNNPHMTVRWDTFVDSANLPTKTPHTETQREEEEKKPKKKKEAEAMTEESPGDEEFEKPRKKSISSDKTRSASQEMGHQRRPSVAKAAQHAYVNPTAPIILFIGGPGGGKTKYAAKVRDALESKGLVHICVPDLIKEAIKRYKTVYPEWKEASRKYDRGELISNDLIQMLVKAEMGRYPNANAYFLEGFPREAKQVEDFEKNVRNVNLAMILDYDEETLRTHMMNRGLDREVIDRRINEFRNKTLPSAKYFDDHRLLYLIPGEKDDNMILDRMKKLVRRAMESGVSIVAKHPAATSKGQGDSTTSSREPSPSLPSAKRKVKSRATTGENPTPQGGEVFESSTSKGSETESKLNTEREKDTARPTTTDTTARSKPQTPTTPGTFNNKSLSRVATNEFIHTTAAPGEAEQNSFENNTQNGEQSNPPITREPSKTNLSQNQSRPSTSKSKQSRPGTGTDGVIRQNPASKPPTQTVSRPATSASKKSTAANSRPPSVPKTPTAEENGTSRPPTTAVEMEKLPEENVVDPSAEANVRLLSASTVSRLPSAADRFPKGLSNNAPVILILGAPGSNKKEMAEKVAKKYEGFVHISMGDLLRKKVNDNPEDELWNRVGKKMEAGEQIPMKICREILYSAVHEMGNRSWGYVIEGYPRTLAQAEDIESQLGRLDVAILLDCTEQFCKDNISKRFEEAKESGHARLDDDEQSLKQKLALFKQNTLPMLKHLDEKKKLRVIEGDGPVDRLFNTVTELVDSTVFANDGKTNIPELETGRDLRTAGSVAS